MTEQLKEFIQQNIDLIEENNFDDLYYYAAQQNLFVGKLSQVLLDAKINPLPYMDYVVPSMFEGCNFLEIYVPDNIRYISRSAFRNCSNLYTVSFPAKLIALGPYMFQGTTLMKVEFRGTKEQFLNIKSRDLWNLYSNVKRVVCTDGIIEEEL